MSTISWRRSEPSERTATVFAAALVLGLCVGVLLLPMQSSRRLQPPESAQSMNSFLHWMKEETGYRDALDDESPVLSERTALSTVEPTSWHSRMQAHLHDTRNVQFHRNHEVADEDTDNNIGASEAAWRQMQHTARTASWASPSGPPKIALLFLARGPMPHDHLWERFIRENSTLVSVYLHAAPGFQYNSSTTRAPSFFGRQVPSTYVEWGNASIVDAERRLLAAALADRNNERFVLLSESCIPIRNLTFVYHYLFADNWKSYLDSFIDMQNRYHAHLSPTISVESWRKGSQWFALNREHARLIVNDDLYYNTLRKYCIVDCPRGNLVACRRFCAPDEHYTQVLMAVLDRENEIHRRPVHFANWWPISRAHPKKWVVQEATRELIQDIQARTEVWRPLEKEQLQCGQMPSLTGNATVPRPCFLFARKFSPRAGRRIATFAAEVIGLPELSEQVLTPYRFTTSG